MKNFLALKLVVLTLSLLIISCGDEQVKKEDLQTDSDKISYSIGRSIGQNLRESVDEVNYSALEQGIKDGMTYAPDDTTAPFLLTDRQTADVMKIYQQNFLNKRAEKQRVAAAEAKEEGEKFLSENKLKEGVIVTESGLQYKVIKSGDGPSPKITDKVKTHYSGKLLDGTEFDSSIRKGTPAVFALNQVIKGWIEALQLMKVGDKWELYVPAELAYGERGKSPSISPNQTLIFEIELLGIEK